MNFFLPDWILKAITKAMIIVTSHTQLGSHEATIVALRTQLASHDRGLAHLEG